MADVNRPGTGASWDTEDAYWRDNFTGRPYAAGRTYEQFQPGYRYGFESGRHHMGRRWEEAEPDLRAGWDRYEHRGDSKSTWEEIKDAVRDAWHRVTGSEQEHEAGTPRSTTGRTTNM